MLSSLSVTAHLDAEAAFALQSDSAVILIDATSDVHRILAANSAFETLTGLSPGDLEDRRFLSFKGKLMAAAEVPQLRQFLKEGREGAVQTVAAGPGGCVFSCAVFLRAIRGVDGRANVHAATYLPLKPDSDGENSLITSERAMEFLATMAHELRNPMTPILGHLQMMRKLVDSGESTPRMSKLVERLELAVGVFSRRATLLMEVSRIASGALKLKPYPFDLRQVAAEAVLRHRGIADAQSITLELLDGPPVMGVFDQVATEQIFDNLISNALKFCDRKPIEISLDSDEDIAILQVRDHGVGIPAERKDSIFDSFDQGNLVLRSGGFGIGLWVVRHLVEAMQGSVSVESVVGQGSVFIVKLPLRPRA